MVHQDQAAGRAGNGGRGEWRNHDRPRELQTDLSELDVQHSRLVHLATVVVGASRSGMALQVWGNCGCPRNAGEMFQVWRFGTETRHRCAGHMVFFRTAAVHDSRLAGKDARSGDFYPTTLLITAYEILFFWV